MATYLFHKMHGMKLFQDDGEAADLIGVDGWADSPATVDADEEETDLVPVQAKDAEAESKPAQVSEADALEALRAEARALGIKVDKRWGDERLTAEIAKAKAA